MSHTGFGGGSHNQHLAEVQATHRAYLHGVLGLGLVLLLGLMAILAARA